MKSGVNLDTAVRFPDRYFLLECKISAIWQRFPFFCILYAGCPPYFYFRFVWPTDLESIPHASTPTSISPTKFEVDMTTHCRVIAFLSADTSRDFVTLTFDLLTLNSCCTWRVAWPSLPPSLKTLRLFVQELRVTMVPIDYYWKCVRVHCACAESRDSWLGGQKQLHFWNPRPRFAHSLCNFGGSTMKIIKVICENNARPGVKKTHKFLRMREITWCVKDALNVLLQSLSSTSTYRRPTELQKLSI